MTKSRIQKRMTNVRQKPAYRGGRWCSGISRRPIYRGYSPCYSWPRFESRTGLPLLCVILSLSTLFSVSLHCPVIKGMKKPKKIIKQKNTAYICMTQKRIQTPIQMYEKNTYICMKKTHIQMYEKNTHTNV